MLAEVEADEAARSAESLLACVDRVLAQAGLPLDGVASFALTIGPGSFTALRVGLATLKGLAFAAPRPVAAVSSLAALAQAAGPDPRPALCLIDASRGEFYAAGFVVADGAVRRWGPAESVYAPAELAAQLPGPCRLVGSRLDAAAPVLARCGARWEAPCVARARDVAVLGGRLIARGEHSHPAELLPRYLRRAEAEARRTGQRLEGP